MSLAAMATNDNDDDDVCSDNSKPKKRVTCGCVQNARMALIAER